MLCVSSDEDSGKVLEGAVGSVAVDAAGLSSDEDSEKCPICLNSFHEQPVATPESCEHYFCLDCILEWSNVRLLGFNRLHHSCIKFLSIFGH